MKNRYLIYIALLILTLSITLGVTYSYLAAKINNRESSSTIKVESGQLSITYENNSGNIILNNIIPGDSVTKQFTLTGFNNTKPNAITTNTDLKYKIGIVIDNNTFSEGALTYSLTKDSTSSSNGKTADDSTGTIKSSGIQYIGKGYFVSGANNDKHIYNLTISFPDTNEDQSIDQGASFACHVTVKDNSIVEPTTFAEDSWETIALVVKSGQSKAYQVGSEKEVEISGQNYTVRVANNTTPDECNGTNFSQTACGFVLEFVDIVEVRNMNNSSTNTGGWPSSDLRTYANGEFLNKLPSNLQDAIIDTKVISGHGNTEGETNFTSTDKIYLFSNSEIIQNSDKLDTAYDKTRQLDYYKRSGASNENFSSAKKMNDIAVGWWLRTPPPESSGYGDNKSFWTAYADAGFNNINAYQLDCNIGFSPAFRIG